MITILRLPGYSSFLDGYYGLEACYVRGIVSVRSRPNMLIQQLTIEIKGEIFVEYEDKYSGIDRVSRNKVLFKEKAELLANFLVTGAENIDIPFQLQMPQHERITSGFGPCGQYLPNSSSITGTESYYRYSARTVYSVTASLERSSKIPFINKLDTCRVEFPLRVHDSRLIKGILYNEERHWKSHIGEIPFEYDIVVGSCVIGPRDELDFSYRILVHPFYASIGIKVREVSLSIKEIHTVGEDRCCILDDRPSSVFAHVSPDRIRSMNEVFYWSNTEYPTRFIPDDDPTILPYGINLKREDSYAGLAVPNRKYAGNDGIYVQRSVKVKIPPIEIIRPSTSRPLYRPDDHICQLRRPRDAFMNIRHVYKVTIHLLNYESTTVEAGCYVSAVNKKSCERLFLTDPEILPSLDYDKLIGIENWVPEYSPSINEPFENEATNTTFGERRSIKKKTIPGESSFNKHPSIRSPAPNYGDSH